MWVEIIVSLVSGVMVTLKVVCYYSIKRALIRRLIYDRRCDERLKAKVERSTRLTYTGLCGELEHLQIETRK